MSTDQIAIAILLERHVERFDDGTLGGTIFHHSSVDSVHRGRDAAIEHLRTVYPEGTVVPLSTNLIWEIRIPAVRSFPIEIVQRRADTEDRHFDRVYASYLIDEHTI